MVHILLGSGEDAESGDNDDDGDNAKKDENDEPFPFAGKDGRLIAAPGSRSNSCIWQGKKNLLLRDLNSKLSVDELNVSSDSLTIPLGGAEYLFQTGEVELSKVKALGCGFGQFFGRNFWTKILSVEIFARQIFSQIFGQRFVHRKFFGRKLSTKNISAESVSAENFSDPKIFGGKFQCRTKNSRP